MAKVDILLNAKGEWGFPTIPRLRIEVGDQLLGSKPTRLPYRQGRSAAPSGGNPRIDKDLSKDSGKKKRKRTTKQVRFDETATTTYSYTYRCGGKCSFSTRSKNVLWAHLPQHTWLEPEPETTHKVILAAPNPVASSEAAHKVILATSSPKPEPETAHKIILAAPNPVVGSDAAHKVMLATSSPEPEPETAHKIILAAPNPVVGSDAAHKVMLATSSPVFRDMLKRNKHPNPLINMRGAKVKQSIHPNPLINDPSALISRRLRSKRKRPPELESAPGDSERLGPRRSPLLKGGVRARMPTHRPTENQPHRALGSAKLPPETAIGDRSRTPLKLPLRPHRRRLGQGTSQGGESGDSYDPRAMDRGHWEPDRGG